jgi:hypothetical protein
MHKRLTAVTVGEGGDEATDDHEDAAEDDARLSAPAIDNGRAVKGTQIRNNEVKKPGRIPVAAQGISRSPQGEATNTMNMERMLPMVNMLVRRPSLLLLLGSVPNWPK